MNYREEIMSAEFTKHLIDLDGKNGGFHMVAHNFTGPDKGGPHCHPFDFTTHILKGSYIERRFDIHSDGTWSYEEIERKAGTSFVIEAETIHSIIALPEGECWTVIIPGPKKREPGFWSFMTPTGIWFQ